MIFSCLFINSCQFIPFWQPLFLGGGLWHFPSPSSLYFSSSLRHAPPLLLPLYCRTFLPLSPPPPPSVAVWTLRRKLLPNPPISTPARFSHIRVVCVCVCVFVPGTCQQASLSPARTSSESQRCPQISLSVRETSRKKRDVCTIPGEREMICKLDAFSCVISQISRHVQCIAFP